MLLIENLLRYICAKKYQNRARFDKVAAKIKWCSFFTHVVNIAQPNQTALLCYIKLINSSNCNLCRLWTGSYLWEMPIHTGVDPKFLAKKNPMTAVQSAGSRVPTTLQNSFSLTFPDKMNNFPTNFFIHDTSKTILSTQM